MLTANAIHTFFSESGLFFTKITINNLMSRDGALQSDVIPVFALIGRNSDRGPHNAERTR